MKYIYYSLFILLLYSCQEKPTNTIIKEFEKRGAKIPAEVDICIIMPSVGCGACIDEGVQFLRRNQESLSKMDTSLLIVFTSIVSKKLMYRSLEGIELPQDRLLFDFDNKYRINSDKAIYPVVLYFQNGDFEDIQYQSPDSPETFAKLEHLINQENR